MEPRPHIQSLWATLATSTTKSPVARRLRELRKQRGLSQRQLGILAGIDPSSASPRMNQYEQGKHVPDYQMSSRLAEVLEVPTAYLYTEEDELAAVILMYVRAEEVSQRKCRDLLDRKK